MAEPFVAAGRSAVPLTRRASLNVVAFILELVVKTGVSLVLTPLLVDWLGTALFGVWEMLGRLALPGGPRRPTGGSVAAGGCEPPAAADADADHRARWARRSSSG